MSKPRTLDNTALEKIVIERELRVVEASAICRARKGAGARENLLSPFTPY